ncbi:MAG: hypothetical protein AAF602_27820, partial [Myxococcota bacterium]
APLDGLDVLAVVRDSQELNDTDDLCGISGLDYPDHDPNRGLESQEGYTFVTTSAGGQMVKVTHRTTGDLDQIRIVVVCPW